MMRLRSKPKAETLESNMRRWLNLPDISREVAIVVPKLEQTRQNIEEEET